ncbi:MAG: hypothetical protein M1824_005672 [Vezdaea acicularis]|nr:MAG: hypothetical protein M1824_005672 [Vezdaea acicularis]
MRLRIRSPSALSLVALFCLISLFATYVRADDLPTLGTSASTNNALPGTDKPTSTTGSDSASSSNSESQTTASSKSGSQSTATTNSATTTGSSGSSSAKDSKSTAASSSTGTTTFSVTATGSTATGVSSIPTTVSISASSAAATDDGGITGSLPKISGAFSYPPPTVPPTANAPYMRKSSVPEGTVFIAVGACLGALGLAVLAWRGLVMWSLRRSVKRAALHQNVTDSKHLFTGGTASTKPGFYSATVGSTLSLDHLGSGARNSTVGPKGHTPNSSLFFSPTAAAGGLTTPGNRGSGYHPSGYYPSGASAPGNGAGMTHIGSSPAAALSRMGGGPQAHGYSRATSGAAPSPPVSPSLPPSRGTVGGVVGGVRNGSMSSLNLNQPPAGRAPSTYLEDLFEDSVRPGTNGYRPGTAQ